VAGVPVALARAGSRAGEYSSDIVVVFHAIARIAERVRAG
jgi:hypothetical protein